MKNRFSKLHNFVSIRCSHQSNTARATNSTHSIRWCNAIRFEFEWKSILFINFLIHRNDDLAQNGPRSFDSFIPLRLRFMTALKNCLQFQRNRWLLLAIRTNQFTHTLARARSPRAAIRYRVSNSIDLFWEILRLSFRLTSLCGQLPLSPSLSLPQLDVVYLWLNDVVLRRMAGVRLNFTSQVFRRSQNKKRKNGRKMPQPFRICGGTAVGSWMRDPRELTFTYVAYAVDYCRWTTTATMMMIEPIKMLWRTADRQFIP